MNIRVVCISRQVGTVGEEVARAVAERLEFRYIDYQVVQEAATDAGVSTETVSESEHSPSLMTRFLEALARSPGVPVTGWADPAPLTTSPLFTSSDYRRFVEDAIRDIASQGNVVIVGHAAQVILRERFDTVRVFVTGSNDFRARRVMVGMGVDLKTALKTIERTDGERVDYFRRFYDTGWLLPCTYDLTLNTDHINPSQAADVIARLCELR